MGPPPNDRHALDRAPHRDGGAPRGYLPARLRPAGSARRLQTRSARLLRGDGDADRQWRRPDHPPRDRTNGRAGRAGRKDADDADRWRGNVDNNPDKWQRPTSLRISTEQVAGTQRTMLVRIGQKIQEVSREVSRAPRVLSQGAGAPDGEAARGRARAAPSPPSASFASLMPRGGSPGHPRLVHNPLAAATRGASPRLAS